MPLQMFETGKLPLAARALESLLLLGWSDDNFT